MSDIGRIDHRDARRCNLVGVIVDGGRRHAGRAGRQHLGDLGCDVCRLELCRHGLDVGRQIVHELVRDDGGHDVGRDVRDV